MHDQHTLIVTSQEWRKAIRRISEGGMVTVEMGNHETGRYAGH